MCGLLLVDTHWSMMILPLLSYVTRWLTSRTSATNRYDPCLSNMCNYVVISVAENLEFPTQPEACAARSLQFRWLLSSRANSLSPVVISPEKRTLTLPKFTLSLTRKVLSIKSPRNPSSPNPQPPALMAASSNLSTGKRSTTSALSPACKRLRTASSLSLVYSSVSIKLLIGFLEGVGLSISPSLPLFATPLNF